MYDFLIIIIAICGLGIATAVFGLFMTLADEALSKIYHDETDELIRKAIAHTQQIRRREHE
jgi:hypothetical protein